MVTQQENGDVVDPKIGRRICLASQLGTIRYLGPVPRGSNTLWFGIEWDDPTRGKHSGMHEGVQYFTTTLPNSGSFIRASKIAPDCFARSFLEALEEKYLTEQPSDSVVRFGGDGVEVETVGWDKISKKVGRLDCLREVGLKELSIGFRGGSRGDVRTTCPAIVDLDMSRNLFGTWTEVAEICCELESLESLRLAYNRFAPLEEKSEAFLDGAFSKLRALTLIGTFIPWKDVETLQQWLPALEELHFGFNDLEGFEGNASVQGFQRLRLLNLEHNRISSWADVRKLAHLPELRTLMLNNNCLRSIEAPEPGEFQELTVLNINDNQVESWISLNALSSFPNLTEVRIRRNPVLSEVPSDDVHVTLIARLRKVTVLNGSAVTPRARLDAELFYLNQCARILATAQESETSSFATSHPRYEELCRLHGAPTPVPTAATSTLLKDRLLTVVFSYNNRKVKKKIPKTLNIRALRLLSSRLYNLKEAVYLKRIAGGNKVEVSLDDDLRDVDFCGLEDGDEVLVET